MAKDVTLVCEICLSRNYKTTTNESRKERLQLNKYCKTCNSKTLHKETR